MNTATVNFYDVESTGKLHGESVDRTGSINQHYPKVFSAVMVIGMTLLGSPHDYFQKTELLCTESQIKQEVYSFQSNILIFLSAKEQLSQVKKVMGLNISEMAAILLVSRPTIYDWLESQEPNIRKKHIERLTSLTQVCNEWKKKNIGRLGSYLHKQFNNENSSLFNLLTKESLDTKKVNDCLDNIAVILGTKKQKAKMQEKILQEHGFEPISNEDRDDRLNDIEFLD